MAFKLILVCASAFLLELTSSQCTEFKAANTDFRTDNLLPSISTTLSSSPSYISGSNLASSNGGAFISGRSLESSNGGFISGSSLASSNGGVISGGSLASSSRGALIPGNSLSPSNGGSFIVQSYSSIAPTGISVFSDKLAIEGPLAVTGQLPFAATVALDGSVPSTGQAIANYSCGDGNVAIVSESVNLGQAAQSRSSYLPTNAYGLGAQLTSGNLGSVGGYRVQLASNNMGMGNLGGYRRVQSAIY